MKVKIFIVDDHFMVIEGLRSLLENDSSLEWMGHAINGSDCLTFLENKQPNIILMDINLPDINGIELCKRVKETYPKIKILGLSTYHQQAFIHDMLQSGASGYLLKNASKDELLDAIETVMNGKKYIGLDLTETLNEHSLTKPIITKREREVLGLICDGFTNPEISEKLFISLPTANTHRKSLLAKFGAKNVATLVKMAMENKWV